MFWDRIFDYDISSASNHIDGWVNMYLKELVTRKLVIKIINTITYENHPIRLPWYR